MRIEIGTVEIHAPAPAAPPAATVRKPAPRRPALSLDAYLSGKGGGA
ncbi:hypothetical protein RNZ50_03200 [Paracoccaceae bacterium Fryx2]|nr:hypothetical protein [Paracoccaceae bacterium Fryx2]